MDRPTSKRKPRLPGLALAGILAMAMLVTDLASAQARGYIDRLPIETPLSVSPSDIRIENSNDGGYVLWVRAKPGIKSILITESTEPGDHKVATYAMRSPIPHPFNADQKRIIDGKPVERPDLYFLVSSSPLPDAQFGQAFRLFLPYVIEYGYPDSRHGEIPLFNETFLSIRTFALPWADYAGAYQDNPYRLLLTQEPPKTGTAAFNKAAFTVFELLAENRKLRSASGGKGLGQAIRDILERERAPELDFVLCLDATASMQPYVDFVKKDLVPLLKSMVPAGATVRYAFVEYRDYFEEFIYRITPFTQDFGVLQRGLDRYRPMAGGDVPEAVDEALYGAIGDLKWQSPRRIIVLVGDAPPHPFPRGKVTHQMVLDAAKEKGVTISPIILPTDSASAETVRR